MQKQLYIVEYDSADWAAAPYHCLVLAETACAAEMKAEGYANEHMQEEFQDEYAADDYENHDGAFAHIISVKPLEGSGYEQYVTDPSQECFYPKVNF